MLLEETVVEQVLALVIEVIVTVVLPPAVRLVDGIMKVPDVAPIVRVADNEEPVLAPDRL